MVAVTNTLLAVGEDTPASGYVEIGLVAGQPAGGWTGSVTYMARWREPLDDEGTWTVNLATTTGALSGAYYEITESVEGVGGARPVTTTYHIVIGSSASPQNARTLAVDVEPATSGADASSLVGGANTWAATQTFAADLDVAGNLGLGAPGPSYSGKLDVQDAGQAIFAKNTGSSGHAITGYYAPSGSVGAASAAGTFVSDGTFTTLQVSDQSKSFGSFKLTHRGWSDSTDSSNALLSTDAQTWDATDRTVRSTTGSRSQGWFHTSTDSDGGAGLGATIVHRLKWGAAGVGGQNDIFVIRRLGTNLPWALGVNLAVGGTPAGYVDVRQLEDTKPGLHIRGHSTSSADLAQLKESGGATRVWATALGSFVVGQSGTAAGLAVGATDGFLYIPKIQGAPTTAPTTQNGAVAIAFDTANNKIVAYDGAWLATAALS